MIIIIRVKLKFWAGVFHKVLKTKNIFCEETVLHHQDSCNSLTEKERFRAAKVFAIGSKDKT